METIELARVVAPIILFLMMIGMGLGLSRRDFTDLFKAPAAVAIGTVGQVVLLPLMGVFVVWVTGLQGALALGVLILALCPGGVASNTITYLVRGDVALSISLTVISSVVAFLSVPLLTALVLAQWGQAQATLQLPMGDTVLRLFLLTIVPLAIGMSLKRGWPHAAARLEKPLRVLGFSFLMLMILAVVVKEHALIRAFADRLGASLVLLFGGAMGLAALAARLARLNVAQSRSIVVEIGVQNSALALVIASLLGSVDMAIPAILYSVLVCLAAVAGLALLGVLGHVRRRRPEGRAMQP